jgi:hypothetical protein
MNEIKKEIAIKFNINIARDIRKIDAEQEYKILDFISALSKSQVQVHGLQMIDQNMSRPEGLAQ